MATRHLTRAEAKKALGDMPERTFAQWCARGLPVEGELDAARYPWPEVFRWLLDQKERRGREAAAPDSNINDSRKREAAARADLAELDVAERRRELMTVADYERLVSGAMQRIRAQLLTLKTKLPPEVIGVRDITEAIGKVDPVVDELLAELYVAKDVPDGDEDAVLDEDEEAVHVCIGDVPAGRQPLLNHGEPEEGHQTPSESR
mgnify:CR=1 FL=1